MALERYTEDEIAAFQKELTRALVALDGYSGNITLQISAGLNTKVGGYSGLLGVLLPSFPLLPIDQYRYEDVPARVADNAQTGYAQVYTWRWLTSSAHRVKEAIQAAFDARVSKSDKIINSRPQMIYNTCD